MSLLAPSGPICCRRYSKLKAFFSKLLGREERYMTAKVLMLISAGTLLSIGALHIIFTFFTRKLDPQDPALQARMSQVPLALIKRTDMWSCWIGFNVSHGIALMLFGLVYGFLAAAHGEILFNSPFLLTVGLIVVASVFALGTAYWFRRPPYIFIGVPLACYAASMIMSLA
jgi:hypothetical protein